MNEKELESLEQDSTQKYLDTINELKQNTVSKEKYEKILEENRQLLNNIVNNNVVEKKEVEKIDKDKLRKVIVNPNSTDLEIVSAAVELRKEILKEGGRDPFLPNSPNYSATYNDMQGAEKVAKAFEHCIEVADGNDSVFINELNRITNDSPLPKKRK